MSARFYTDSKGRTQYVLRQADPMSCGLACVAMTEQMYKQMCLIDPEGRARELSQKYPGKWTHDHGSNLENLSQVLNAEEVKAYRAVDVGPGAVANYLRYYAKERTPVIVRIVWEDAPGSHNAVCKQVDPDGTAIFLDPGYGLVEIPLATLPVYQPRRGVGRLSGKILVTYR